MALARVMGTVEGIFKENVNRPKVSKALTTTLVVASIILALGVILASIPNGTAGPGSILVKIGTPFVAFGAIFAISKKAVNSENQKKADQTWKIAMVVAAIAVIVGIVLSSVSSGTGTAIPEVISKALIGVGAPVLGVSLLIKALKHQRDKGENSIFYRGFHYVAQKWQQAGTERASEAPSEA